jgi:PAS domain S-box-containing protein/putative nucleotidyltransferase with HDIG domain
MVKERGMIDDAGRSSSTAELAQIQMALQAAKDREHVSQETRRALLAMLEDLDQNQQEIKQSHDKLKFFRDLLDYSNDGIQVIDPATLRFVDVNETECRNLGYTRGELLSLGVRDIDPGFGPNVLQMIDAQIEANGRAVFERVHYRKDGSTFPVEISLKFVRTDQDYAVAIVRDITARHEADEVLKASEARYRRLYENVPIMNFTVAQDGEILAVNRFGAEQLGYSAQELIGNPVFNVFLAEDVPLVRRQLRECFESPEQIFEWELRKVHKDGQLLWVHETAIVQQENGRAVLLVACQNVTERKRTDAAMRKSEAAFRMLFDSSRDALLTISPEAFFLSCNPATVALFGCRDKAEFLRLSPVRISPAFQPDGRRSDERMPEMMQEALTQGSNFFDWKLKRMDGTEFYADILLTRMEVDGTALLQASIRDISERKRADLALRRALRAQHTLSSCNGILVHADNEEHLLADMCANIIDQGGYRMVWIGFAENDEVKTVRPVASKGYEAGYLESLRISWGDGEYGKGPTGRAVRLGEPQVASDIQTDPHYAPWREQAIERGYKASIALPLKEKNGQVFGVLNIYAAEAQAFDEAELSLLQELSRDLAFGIVTLRMRIERDHFQAEHLKSTEQLKDALVGTIRAIALTVEKRDPYTAGHQGRVAQLAVAIAGELGLDANRIEGLKLGAMIHDIGKIYVPAEILNRPGKLSDHEFGMIKSHTEVGYDIIKDVKFPWPVADMVLQHHERMDGTGYPNGLRGEDIILEARILGVADVVEAITAHRPYRPAIGIEAGLTEIEGGRGKTYDSTVVDACLRLFRDKGFSLSDGAK